MKNLQNFQFLFCLLIFITFSYCGHSQNNLQEQIEILYQQVDTAKGNDKAITCYKLGKRFSQISEYKLALDYHLKALRITSNEKLNDLELTVLLGISAIYGRMGNYEKTIEVGQYVLNKAILLKDTSVIVAAYNNIGTAYLNLKQFEIAKKNINTALIVLPTNSSIRYRSGILNNLGLIHLDQNRTDSALIYFHKALLLADSVKDVSMIVSKKLNLGEAYIKLGDYKKAKTYLTEGLEVADKESLLSLQLDLNLRLHELYIAKDNIKMAYFHLNQSHILKDSLNQKIQDEDIKNAEIRIAVRNKENQNQLLTKGNKIKSLKLRSYQLKTME